MIVPKFWAEGRIRERVQGRQVTVRRFGWSDASQADAQAMAEMLLAEIRKNVGVTQEDAASTEEQLRPQPRSGDIV